MIFFSDKKQCNDQKMIEKKQGNNQCSKLQEEKQNNNQKKHEEIRNNFLTIYTGLTEKLLVLTIVMIFILALLLIFTIYNISKARENIKRSEQYFAQAIEEQNKIQEKVKINQEKQMKTPKLTEVGKENIKHIYNSENKRAFLTFDDGPSNNTAKILDILNENGIKATFFMVGSQVEIFPETTRRVYNEGHYIASHGYSHVYSQIYQSPETVLQEFNQCNDIIKKTIGNDEYNSHLFRFPGGSIRWKVFRSKRTGKRIT